VNDFAALHRAGDPLILPNVWDVASARCLVEAGFPALGTTSLGAAAAAGAAGVNIEDAMGSAEVHAALIRSVKRELPQLFVNARTDTYWQRAGDLAETSRPR